MPFVPPHCIRPCVLAIEGVHGKSIDPGAKKLCFVSSCKAEIWLSNSRLTDTASNGTSSRHKPCILEMCGTIWRSIDKHIRWWRPEDDEKATSWIP